MQLLVTIPEGAAIAVIEDSLRALGCELAPVKARKPRRVSSEDLPAPVVFTRRLADGSTEQDELDPVEVKTRIRKLMAEVTRRANADGRNPGHFPVVHGGRPTAEEYIAAVCARWQHVPAAYNLGGDLVKA